MSEQYKNVSKLLHVEICQHIYAPVYCGVSYPIRSIAVMRLSERIKQSVMSQCRLQVIGQLESLLKRAVNL